MSASRRIQQESAWILHHRPFQDSSQILDILSRDHGRLSVVARGSRSAKSKLKGILRPFLPLKLSWVIRSDMGTLTGAEIDGSPTALAGDALLSGYYANELLLNFLHKHDAQPQIFDLYGVVIRNLAGSDNIAMSLRMFELDLLRTLGYAVNLDHDTDTHQPLDADQEYEYRIEHGPVPALDSSRPLVFSGKSLIGIHEGRFEDPEILRDAGRLLRNVISFHLGGKELKSRKVLKEIRRASNRK